MLDPKAVEQKTVNITNHTKGKITCMWMKDEADILPLKTASFRVTFRPNAANQVFSADLECYTFYKSMRDYRLVEVSSLVSFAQCYRTHICNADWIIYPQKSMGCTTAGLSSHYCGWHVLQNTAVDQQWAESDPFCIWWQSVKGTVHFKPTCLGTASTRLFEVKNASRIALRFAWKTLDLT